MAFTWPNNLPKLSLWDIACAHTGQNAQDLTPTNETRHKLAELVHAARDQKLWIEFVQPGNDHGFITGLAGDGNRAAADADWRKLDCIIVRRERWAQYQEAWLRSIEEDTQKSRDSVMSNDKYGIVQLPGLKLIHPELLAQLIAYAKSPIPDDTRLHGPLKKETPDGPHQWKIEPLSGKDWQLVNKLCGGKPPAPCSPQKFEEWRVPFDKSSEKPKWDFHPEFQPSDAMQRAQSKWHGIYAAHLQQLCDMIAAEKLDLWTMDGLRTSDVYDHAALAYGHMRIDDAKAYLARCSIPFVPSIDDLPCVEEKTKDTKKPAPDELPAITLAVQSPVGHQNRALLIGMRESATLGELAYLVTTTIGGNYNDAVALLIEWVGAGKLPANRNPNINDHNLRKAAPIDTAITTARVADLRDLLKVLSGGAQSDAVLPNVSRQDASNSKAQRQVMEGDRKVSEQKVENEIPQSNCPPPVPSPDIAAAFAGLKGWNTKRWSRALGDPPIWLELARVQQGSRQSQRPATWNPVKIALDLFGDGNNGVTLTKLDTIFARPSLKAWESDWQNKTDILRF